MYCLRQVPHLLRGVRQLSTDSHIYDVVIVGGGMVGMSLAAALGTHKQTSGLRVAVVDRSPVKDVLEQDIRHPPDYRVSTVVESSIRFFEQAGAWSHIQPLAREFSSMQVWDTVGHGCLQWEGRDVGRDRMGAVVENAVIQSACYRAASACPNVSIIAPGTITDIAFPPYSHKASSTNQQRQASDKAMSYGSLASITLDSGFSEGQPQTSGPSASGISPSTIQARLVVAADGPRSETRSQAGLRTVAHAYKQRGVVATVATEPHSTAWQRFLPTGPIALLPTRNGYSNIVWSTNCEHAHALEQMAPDEFGAEVNKALAVPGESEGGRGAAGALAGLLSRAAAAGGGAVRPPRTPPVVEAWVGQRPASFPLRMQHAGRYVRPRLALIGDAAHVVHPLAGQGVNLGFGDAAALRAVIAAAVAIGGDIGDMRILEDEYERPRMAINAGMSMALHALNGIFAVGRGPVAEVRSAGLALVNAAGPLRNELMRVAMGDAPTAPGSALASLMQVFPAPQTAVVR
eukprot:jgi/Ulvmu1/9862/UM057_0016.1